ncbi:MAG: EAL domain-containing protein [Pseudomonadota bacterium]
MISEDQSLSDEIRGETGYDDLSRALERQEIEVLFQPQFSCASDEVIGAEALARWHHPVRGKIGGQELFEIAEQHGLVLPLSSHIILSALNTAASWPGHLDLSLNMTPQELCDPGYAANFLKIAMACGVELRNILVEVTEQTLLNQLDIAMGELRLLKAAGVRVALDDFGAGFCNFNYLKRLPLDHIKLDRSMVEGIGESERDLAIFRAIVALARALELKITAEGIEDEAQRKAVAEEGCDYWQGFLRAQPMTSAEMLDIASAANS